MKINIKDIPASIWFLAAVSLALAFISKDQYLLTLFAFAGIYVIAVSGLDLLFGYSGQISMGHAAYYAIGAYTSALLSTKLGVPVFLSMIAAMVVSGIFGIIVAFPAAKLVRHFLSLLTIAFGQMVYIFACKAKAVTNAMAGVKRIPKLNLFGFEFRSNLSCAILILVLCVLFLIVKQRIVHSSSGRALMAIRENVVAADGMEINIKKYKIMAFAISAVYTGMAGALYAHIVSYISPESFQSSQSQLLMTMLLFGGMGNLAGPIIGAVIVTILNETLQGFSSYRMLIYGFIILASVLYMPKGLYGIVEKIKGLFGRRVKADADN